MRCIDSPELSELATETAAQERVDTGLGTALDSVVIEDPKLALAFRKKVCGVT
jgi:hypothetical protein